MAISYTSSEVVTAMCVWEAMIDAKQAAAKARHLIESHSSPLLDLWERNGTGAMRDSAASLVDIVDETWGLLPESMTDLLAFDWEIVPMILNEIRWEGGGPDYDPAAQIAGRLASAFTAKMAA